MDYSSGLGYAICCRLIDEFLATRPAHQNLYLIFTTRSQAKSNDTARRLQNYVIDNGENKDKNASWYKRGLFSNLFEKAETVVDNLGKGKREGIAEPRAKKGLQLKRLEAAPKAASSRVTLCPEHVELTCIASVLELSSRLRTSLPRLDVLICNAGTGGVIGIDWLKAARRVPLNFVKELTCPSYKIAAVRWLAGAQPRYRRVGNGSEIRKREKCDTRDGEKVEGTSIGDGKMGGKDPPLGMVFASNVFGHYVLGYEIAPLMSKKKWTVQTVMKEKEIDQRRTVLNRDRSHKEDYAETYNIHSKPSTGLLDRSYERSHIPHDQGPNGNENRGQWYAIQTGRGSNRIPSPNNRRYQLPILKSSRIIWVSSLEAYDHSLHFGGGKDDSTIQGNASIEIAGRSFDDIQGLTHPLAYESSKRLTDILVLTSELDSVRRSWVRNYFSFESSDDTKINRSGTINNENAENSHSDIPNAEFSSTLSSPSTNVLPPRLYLAHPGICATSIVTLPFYLLELLMALSLYVARWVGSPWHTADAYTGAGAPVQVALAGWDHNDEQLENTIKWGSGTDRWGRLVIRKTRVEGWAGGESNSANNGNLTSTTGAQMMCMSDKSSSSSLTTQPSQFEDLGWHCWREMEQLRLEWMERIREAN